MEQNYRFFQNRECEYFPCHKASNPETHNCLFCYCPLYAMKDKCGGNFRYLANGVKDCSSCALPHNSGGYDYIMQHIGDILTLGKK